jgi:hypothetical protein
MIRKNFTKIDDDEENVNETFSDDDDQDVESSKISSKSKSESSSKSKSIGEIMENIEKERVVVEQQQKRESKDNGTQDKKEDTEMKNIRKASDCLQSLFELLDDQKVQIRFLELSGPLLHQSLIRNVFQMRQQLQILEKFMFDYHVDEKHILSEEEEDEACVGDVQQLELEQHIQMEMEQSKQIQLYLHFKDMSSSAYQQQRTRKKRQE